ncbi:MAG: YciI family protein [Dehalococcoidia bacterium]
MEYVCLIYVSEGADDNDPGLMPAYAAFGEEVARKGVMRGGNRLRPVSTATTVRVRGDKTSTTDGPFAETKEQLGGYFILDCKDLDEALAYAAKIPGAKHGSVEVRPVWAM